MNKPWRSSAPNTYGWDAGLTDGSWAGGNKTTYAADDQNTFPKTVTINLGDAVEIKRIAIGVPAFGSTKTIEVSVSVDGASFLKVGRHAFNIRKEEKRLFTFTAMKARQIRLTYPTLSPCASPHDRGSATVALASCLNASS